MQQDVGTLLHEAICRPPAASKFAAMEGFHLEIEAIHGQTLLPPSHLSSFHCHSAHVAALCFDDSQLGSI